MSEATQSSAAKRCKHWTVEHLREPARAFAAGNGERKQVEAAEKEPGIDTERLGRALKTIAPAKTWAETEEAAAKKIGSELERWGKGKEISARTMESWRYGRRPRGLGSTEINVIAKLLSDACGCTTPEALSWLFGYGDDEPPQPLLHVVRGGRE